MRNTSLLAAGVALLAALPFLLSAGPAQRVDPDADRRPVRLRLQPAGGPAGMLSFGHAAYFGVGAFATVHAMNALGGTGLLPTPLLPLVGAVAGLVFGAGRGLVRHPAQRHRTSR